VEKVSKKLILLKSYGIIFINKEIKMRRKHNNTIIICLLTSISFFMISCDFNDVDEDNDFGSGILGNNLNLSGQVYQRMQDGEYEIWNSSEDLKIYPKLGGSGD